MATGRKTSRYGHRDAAHATSEARSPCRYASKIVVAGAVVRYHGDRALRRIGRSGYRLHGSVLHKWKAK